MSMLETFVLSFSFLGIVFKKCVANFVRFFVILTEQVGFLRYVTPGNTNWGGRLNTIDPLIKVSCFVKKVNDIFNIKSSWCKLVSTRRSTVLSLLPFSKTSLVTLLKLKIFLRQFFDPKFFWRSVVNTNCNLHEGTF